ncbi:MAG: Sapep family Mn(2+)-dependent dipeptidase [Anaerovoracaceae bacterium]
MGLPLRLEQKLEENFDEQLRTLRELVAIESVAADPQSEAASPQAPFGEGVERAYQYVLERGRTFGLEAFDADHYGGHLQLSAGGSDGMESGGSESGAEGGSGTAGEADVTHAEGGSAARCDAGEADAPQTLGIVVHLDTVPVGSGWQHEPLAGEEEDGRLYGRGTADDKGPAVAALFAMKAIRDCGIVPRHNIRLILGLDEETDWVGMGRYREAAPAPDFGFTPDADFPVIQGEKGILVFDIARKFDRSEREGLQLRSIRGGSAPNMVADYARAVVYAKKGHEIYEEIRSAAALQKEQGWLDIETKAAGRSLEIVVRGVSAHGAHPELGVNAITGLLRFLGRLPFAGDDVCDFLHFYNRHIGEETDGSSLGCGFSDARSGGTVVNVGGIDLDPESVRLTVNVRYPITCTAEDVYAGMAEVCDRYNLGIIKGKDEAPIYLPAEDPLLTTLMDVYREHTGDTASRPQIIGGGTYARAFEHVVAFGARFPGDEDMAHQKDEYIDLEKWRLLTKIYTDAIYRLACV